MKERKELKATVMTVGASLLVWAIQQLIQYRFIEGGLGVLVAGVFFWTYEHIQMIERREFASEFVDDLNGEAVQGLIETVADHVRTLMESQDKGGGDGS